MKTRNLGSLEVSALGLGCMGMTYAYGPSDESSSMRVLRRYLELGGNFLDTAELYGPHTNEELLGQFLREIPREKVVVATKFGFRFGPNGIAGIDGSAENARRVCEASLKRLGTDYIDLYYQHRVDPAVPIEETVGGMAELVKEGKVRAIGLSEAAPETLCRAAKVHPVTALQSEYSLWSRDMETSGVLSACRELGVGFVPYSPLGRGFLTGAIRKPDDLDPSDWRLTNPRFQEEALKKNLALADEVKAMASRKGCSPAQVALSWLLAQGEDIVPIPGTRHIKYLEDNLGALDVALSKDDLATLDRLLPAGAATGERYPPAMMEMVNR